MTRFQSHTPAVVYRCLCIGKTFNTGPRIQKQRRVALGSGSYIEVGVASAQYVEHPMRPLAHKQVGETVQQQLRLRLEQILCGLVVDVLDRVDLDVGDLCQGVAASEQ